MFLTKTWADKKFEKMHSLLVQSFGNVKKDNRRIIEWLDYFYLKIQQQDKHINYLKQQNSLIPILQSELKNNAKNSEKISNLAQNIIKIKEIISELKNEKNADYDSEIKKIRYQIYQNSQDIERLSALDIEVSNIQKKAYENEKISEKIAIFDEKIMALKSRITYENEPILRRLTELESRFEKLKSMEITQKTALPKTSNELNSVVARLDKLEEKKASIKQKILKKITRNSKEYVKTLIISYIKKYQQISALQLKEMLVEEQGLCSKSSFYRILEEIEKNEDIATIKKGKGKHYLAKKAALN